MAAATERRRVPRGVIVAVLATAGAVAVWQLALVAGALRERSTLHAELATAPPADRAQVRLALRANEARLIDAALPAGGAVAAAGILAWALRRRLRAAPTPAAATAAPEAPAPDGKPPDAPPIDAAR